MWKMEVPLVICSKIESYNIICTVLQLLNCFTGSVILNFAHIGMQCYTYYFRVYSSYLQKKFAVKQHAILYQRQQPDTSCVYHVSCLHIFCCA